MHFDFPETMKQASDADLLKIVTTDRDNYQDAAVIAAEKELSFRKLTTEQITSAESYNAGQHAILTLKANTPLEAHWKVLTFLFPGLLNLVFSGTFKGDGYDRKSRELVKWTLYGLCFYIGIALLSSIF